MNAYAALIIILIFQLNQLFMHFRAPRLWEVSQVIEIITQFTWPVREYFRSCIHLSMFIGYWVLHNRLLFRKPRMDLDDTKNLPTRRIFLEISTICLKFLIGKIGRGVEK